LLSDYAAFFAGCAAFVSGAFFASTFFASTFFATVFFFSYFTSQHQQYPAYDLQGLK
jgi:hypothetical protein